ncbi:MAG: hypothetical protein KKG59_00625 [Nanoarchaeota archaeon]|nr:hypothetical protein [Nanoarchaeota archaeon]
MKEIYNQIWKLAKPYYEKGRPMDIGHVSWMMVEAEKVCQAEGLDDSLLLPLVILHDVGYAEVPNDNPFKIDMRKDHMRAGAEIAERILGDMNYPADKKDKIVYYISVHDNWALGDDSVYEDKIMSVFNDLDFTWIVAPNGLEGLADILEKSLEETLKWVENDDKPDRRPFATETTKKLFETLLEARRKEVRG